MKAGGIIFLTFLSILTVSIFGFWIYDMIRGEESEAEPSRPLIKVEDWEEPSDYKSETPPLPIFNTKDNDNCRNGINLLNKGAVIASELIISRETRLGKSYDQIILKQSENGIYLSNNAEFENWTAAKPGGEDDVIEELLEVDEPEDEESIFFEEEIEEEELES